MTTRSIALSPALSAALPAATLALRTALPLQPAPVELSGRYVHLRPLDAGQDAQALYALSNGSPIHLGERTYPAYDADALVWRYLFQGPFSDLAQFQTYIAETVRGSDRLGLCVVDQASGHPVGVVTFMSNVPAFLRIELGGIWYSPIVQRTPANLESTYLLLGHAFALGYRRVEWKCDSNNERSRRAALRMGFQFEGIQEQHMIVKGRNRDTAWFRLLDHEWPGVKQRLETMLYAHC